MILPKEIILEIVSRITDIRTLNQMRIVSKIFSEYLNPKIFRKLLIINIKRTKPDLWNTLLGLKNYLNKKYEFLSYLKICPLTDKFIRPGTFVIVIYEINKDLGVFSKRFNITILSNNHTYNPWHNILLHKDGSLLNIPPFYHFDSLFTANPKMLENRYMIHGSETHILLSLDEIKKMNYKFLFQHITPKMKLPNEIICEIYQYLDIPILNDLQGVSRIFFQHITPKMLKKRMMEDIKKIDSYTLGKLLYVQDLIAYGAPKDMGITGIKLVIQKNDLFMTEDCSIIPLSPNDLQRKKCCFIRRYPVWMECKYKVHIYLTGDEIRKLS